MPATNRYTEAFKENFNTLGLASVVALSAALFTPLPLIAGIVAEAAYLLFIPDSGWYQARLSKRFDAEVEKRRQELKAHTLAQLRPEMRDRFGRLEEMRRQIDVESESEKEWFREVLRKLDYLLEKFLLFAAKEVEFRRYMESLRDEIGADRQRVPPVASGNFAPLKRPVRRPLTDTSGLDFAADRASRAADSTDRWVQTTVKNLTDHYADERSSIEQTLKSEQDTDTQAVLRKRLDVLTRRQEYAAKIGKILTNLSHQLQLVEDTFGLINDEIRARSPEQILADIDEVVVATDSMSSALEEMSAFDQLGSRV